MCQTDILAQLEGHVSRGEFVQAIDEAKRLMMLPHLSPQQLGRLYRLSGRARAESGDPYGALKLLELAVSAALRDKDWDCLGMARAELGISWLSAGDISNALDSLHAYLLDLKRYSDAKRYLGHVHYNLGLAYRRRKDHERATYHYREALEWFTERGYTIQAGKTHQNLAWLYCVDGKTDEALQELTISESFSPVCGPEFQVEQLVCRAFLLKVQGQIEVALKMAQEVLMPGRRGAHHSHRAHAAWIAGCIALAIHDVQHAEYFAELATVEALKANEPGAMTQANVLKKAISNRKASTDEAVG